MTLYDPQKHPHSTIGTYDPRVDCLYASWTLWHLGYPDQALKRSLEGVAVARGTSRPYSLAYALGFAARFYLFRREGQLAREQAETVMTLSTEQGFSYWLTYGMVVRGGALTEQGQMEEGITQLHQGRAACQAMGAELSLIWALAMLAEAYGKAGQVEEGLTVLAEALAQVEKTGERVSEAELYRLKGELLLQQAKEQATGRGVTDY